METRLVIAKNKKREEVARGEFEFIESLEEGLEVYGEDKCLKMIIDQHKLDCLAVLRRPLAKKQREKLEQAMKEAEKYHKGIIQGIKNMNDRDMAEKFLVDSVVYSEDQIKGMLALAYPNATDEDIETEDIA